MGASYSLPTLVLFATLTFVLHSLYNAVTTHLTRRKFKQQNGCLPLPHAPLLDPIFGLDMMLASIRAGKNHTILDLTTSRYYDFGATYVTKRLGASAIMTMEPANIKAVLATKFKDYAIGPFRAPALGYFLGAGIFTTDGPHWAHSRAMIRPNFVREQVADLEAFESHMQDLLAVMKRQDGRPTVDLQDLFFRFTIDSATGFLFGESVRSLRSAADASPETRFAEAFSISQAESLQLLRLGSLARFARAKKMVGGERAVDVVHAYVDRFVDEAVRFRERLDLEAQARAGEEGEEGEKETRNEKHDASGEKGGYVFLHELAKQTKDKRRIRDELLNVLLAGRDTTASLLGNLFFVLAKRPDVWARLKEEVRQLDGRPPSYEQLRGLKYLKWCLNESLRTHPVVPLNTRIAVNDTVLPTGGGPDGKSPVFVAKHTTVSYSVWAMHRRKDIYGPDADEFRPERWEHLRVGWEYLPFNGGPRICVGQQYALTEASYVTVRLLQSFATIESRDPEDWQEQLTLTLCSNRGCKVALTPETT